MDLPNNFGWHLGVIASHADTLDMRAMLARVRARVQFNRMMRGLDWCDVREAARRAFAIRMTRTWLGFDL